MTPEEQGYKYIGYTTGRWSGGVNIQHIPKTMPNPNIKEEQTPVNLDEIEPDTTGAAENGSDDVECPDSPSGQHEFDTDPEDEDRTICVHCNQEKGE